MRWLVELGTQIMNQKGEGANIGGGWDEVMDMKH